MKMNWIHFIVVGAFFLVLTGAFFRLNPLTLPPWGMILAALPIILLSQYAFSQAYSLGPSFFSAWFTGTAACALFAYLAAVFIFREQIKIMDMGAVAFILLGSWHLIVRT